MIGKFRVSPRDYGCGHVVELMDGLMRIGIIWKVKGSDVHQWSVGDGSLLCGLSSSLEDAKLEVLEAVR